MLYRKLDDMRTGDVKLADARIRPGKPEEADLFADVVVRSFFPEGNAPENIREALTALFQMQGALPFVAEVEGRCVACGAGLIIPEHRIFALFGAGTLPEFRRRGLQTVILQTRMAAAARAGCEYAVIVTQGGTTSQRNAERLGFRVAYIWNERVRLKTLRLAVAYECQAKRGLIRASLFDALVFRLLD